MPPKNKRNKKKKKRKPARQPQPAKQGQEQQPPAKKSTTLQKPEAEEKVEDLQFEDPVPDDIDEEEIIESFENVSLEDVDESENMEGVQPTNKMVWRPGVDDLKQGEELQYDSSAYTCMYNLRTEWPCLSFDVLRDRLGAFRKKFPQTLYFACGSQATNNKNKVSIFKVSDLHRTKHDDADDDEQNSDSETEDLDDDPIIEEKSFDHPGCVNRLRSMPQSSNIIATWSDTGKVHIWDVQHLLKALDTPPNFRLPRLKPLYTFSGHPEEGYAMDWSPHNAGRLLTGDCSKHIYLWERHENGSGWHINKLPYKGHKSSVEDLQWSPTEAQVFASCSVDRTIQIWDARKRDKCAMRAKAHSKDVNVIAWNRLNASLLASGSDDCSVKIWDLRNFSSNSPAGRFNWHKGPITSVEWHPTEETVLGASSEDDSISIWDLSVENDPEGLSSGANLNKDSEVPPQLMFIHQGQNEIKELHFHPQIPSLVLSTANGGFNLFKPENV